MPRPLSYATKGRLELLDSYRNMLQNEVITKDQYNKRIERLNRQELAYRENQQRKKKVAEQKKKEAEERRKAKEEEKQKALEKLKKSKKLALAVKAQKMKVSIRIKEKKRLAKIKPKLVRTDSRLAENAIIEVYSFPKISLANNQEIEIAADMIESKIRYRTSGKVMIALDVEYKRSVEPVFNESEGQWYYDGEPVEANDDDEPIDDEGQVIEGSQKIDTQNKSVATFNYPYERSEVIQAIKNSVRRFNDKTPSGTITAHLKGFTLKYVSVPETGGCDGDTHHKTYNDLKILSPKSSKNNCLFACIHHKLQKRLLCDNTRKALGIPLDTPIHTNQLEAIAKYYDVSIRLFDLTGALTSTYNSAGTTPCDIMLWVNNNGSGHYVLIEGQTHVCETCGKYWVKKHKCNITFRRQMWLNRMSGNRNVIPANIKQEKKFDVNSILYFDLETFKPDDTHKICVYAVSWYCDGKYYQSYGEQSWGEFADFLFQQKDKIVCAYNGAGFDFHFLMNEMLSRGEEMKNVILSNNRLMACKFGNNMRLWDICLFTLSSLKEACKSFGVSADNSKTEFDHFKIRSWEDVYKYRSEVEPYVKRDVLGMKEVVEKFSDLVYDTFGVWLTAFVTLSSMSYAIWTHSTKELLELPDTEKYEFIRESLYGGRTYPQQREFTSKEYSQIVLESDQQKRKEIYSEMKDWIFNGDATSLYPTAMVKYQYPVGVGMWVEGTEINLSNPLQVGFYEVDVVPNQNLIVPVLPRKTKTGIAWDLTTRKGVYTSADLENALRFGYTITKVYKALVYSKTSDIFTDYIMRCYKIKEENEHNPVLRQIGKILMNALYGKMLEKARFEESKICNNIEEVWKFQQEYSMDDVMFVGDKVVTIGLPLESETSDKRIRKPSQIGSFILSYSRRHMLDIMTAVCPKLDEHFFTYTDTDSLHIHASKLPLLDEKGWLSKGLGQLSDDAKGGKIFREINLAPKLYMYLCLMPDGSIKTCMKSKGIPTQYLSPELFYRAEQKVVQMEHRLKKVGIGRNLPIDYRKYDAFSILSVDMERTFYKNQWTGMDFKDGLWYPKK